MSITIEASDCSVKAAVAGRYVCLELSLTMTTIQKMDAVAAILGTLTAQQVTEFLLSEYGDLVQAIEHTEAA
jgi:hypothetical protein